MDDILDDYMEPLINSTIIAEIKTLSDAANLPKSFKEHVKFVKTSKNRGDIVNTWGTTQKPLAIFFNYGTKRHWIEPVNAKALAWSATAGRNANAIYFRGEAKAGDTLFSKGHYVSGVPKTEVMERGFEIGKKRLAIEAGRILEKELK